MRMQSDRIAFELGGLLGLLVGSITVALFWALIFSNGCP